MSGLRMCLWMTLLTASAATAEAGNRNGWGCAGPVMTCAAPMSCAAPANCAMPSCAMPSCAMPMNYGCAAPSCAMPTCAAPANYPFPAFAGPGYAGPSLGGPSIGGPPMGYDDGIDGIAAQPAFGGVPGVMRYPTRGITPPVIPGDELVW